jgi:hypothetical protein
LSYALLAPSSHNTQPWRVDLRDPDRIHLYADPRRALPRADPLNRQLLVSQGCFIETCSIALMHHGWSARMIPLRGDDRDSALAGKVPVVSIELSRGAQRPEPSLFGAIVGRHTNKRAYDPTRMIPSRHLDVIVAAAGVEGCEVQLVTDRARILRLAHFCNEAMAIDVSDRARNQETAAWFRFDDGEVARNRDGFGVAQGGVDGWRKWLAESLFLSRSRAADPKGGFATKSVELAREQASSASAFAWVKTAQNRGSDQVAAGRSYVRAQLAAESLGVRTHPFSQLLQEYPAMASLRAQFEGEFGVTSGETVQMLFRLGYAEPTLHSARRALGGMLEDLHVRTEHGRRVDPINDL